MAAHAKHRPPSSAARWLSCSASVGVIPVYFTEGADESDASVKGTIAHTLLDTAIAWGVVPDYEDIDMVGRVMMGYEWVLKTLEAYGPGTELYSETQLDIPETGEFGTSDIIFVTKDMIHIADYKDGWVPVDVSKNAQMMTYLLGAIARFGERPKYKITVIQPKYSHRDGMIRHDEITPEDVSWFRREVQFAVTQDSYVAGKHCRRTYCPHRANCAAFLAWAPEHLQDAWYPSDINAITDEQLGEVLDHADILAGYRDQLRSEALRRMVRMDRKIPGWDVKKGRTVRSFSSEQAQARVLSKMREHGAKEEDLYERAPVSVAGVERFFKRKFKHAGRNAWFRPFNEAMEGNIAGGDSSLVVERDIDGRKSYKRTEGMGPIKTGLPDVL